MMSEKECETITLVISGTNDYKDDLNQLVATKSDLSDLVKHYDKLLQTLTEKIDFLVTKQTNCKCTVKGCDITTQTLNVEDDIAEISAWDAPKTRYEEKIIGENVNMGSDIVKPNISIPQMNGGRTEEEIYQLWFCYKLCNVKIDGDYPIHRAVCKNDLQAVKRQLISLKAKNISINLENDESCTPLQLAVTCNVQSDIINLLIDYGADLTETDCKGNNLYHLAVMNENYAFIEQFHLRIEQSLVNQFNYDGITALMQCAIEDNCSIAKLLIDLGANMNQQDRKSGKTALFYAVESNSVHTVELLLKKKADKNIRNYSGLNIRDVINEISAETRIKSLIANGKEQVAVENETNNKRVRSDVPQKTKSKRMKIVRK